jgi:hypothetical protein
MQQGRVQLDAEWNEQQDIIAHRAGAEAVDSIGAAGAPKHQAAFGIVLKPADLTPPERDRVEALGLMALAPGDFLLTPGRFYVDGTLCEVEDYFRLSWQPDFPDAKAIALQNGEKHLVYLDVWQRHLTALDDEGIREKALGGPDTTTRTKTVWQVKTKPIGEAKCISDPADWANLGIVTPTTVHPAAQCRLSAFGEPTLPRGDSRSG